jgi:hypothetical protein
MPNILATKSEEGPLPYCKIGAESEGYKLPGPLVGYAAISGRWVVGVAWNHTEILYYYVAVCLIHFQDHFT